MILLDANILMYAAGASHACKDPSAALIERVAAGQVEAAIDAEVLQEILHRYRAIGRWREGSLLYEMTRTIIATVIPIDAQVLDRAHLLMNTHPNLMARDALHAAVCLLLKAEAFCSYDRDFDQIPGFRRVEPAMVR